MPPRLQAAAIAVALLTSAAGCDSPTTLLVEVSLRAGSPAPASLTVSVFDRRARLGRAENLRASPLPGRLIVQGLADADQPLRVAIVDGAGGSRAGASVDVRAHTQNRVALELAADVADGDGDGVPDVVDLCDTAADPQQLDSDADGVSDACDGVSTRDLAIGDLATPDLGPPDLSPPIDFSATPSLCPGSYLFCESFDTAAALTRFGVDTNPPLTSIEIDNTRAYRGSASVKFSASTLGVTAPDTYIAAQLRKTSPLPRSPVWFRFFVYLPSTFPTAGTGLLQLRQNADPYGIWGLSADDRLLVTYSSAIGIPTQRSTTNLPVDRWACVEIGFDFAAADGGTGVSSARVFLDGTEIAALANPPFLPSPPLGLQLLGLETNLGPGIGPSSFWIDEYVVDAQRVGCAN